MKSSFHILFMTVLALLFATSMEAQVQYKSFRESKSVSIYSGKDGTITLKVTTKSGNNSKTFKKTYESYEEMVNDPELEEQGITAGDLDFGGHHFFGSPHARARVPGIKFFGYGGNDPWQSFHFGFDMDSLMSGFGRRGFFFGDDFTDVDSLREQLMKRFDDMDFNRDDKAHSKVISKVKVFIRPARTADKERAGADKMKDLLVNDISFYPNPSDGRFDLELETGNNLPVQVRILGPDGESIYQKKTAGTDGSHRFRIDISRQRRGNYILQVIQNGRALTKRIIIE